MPLSINDLQDVKGRVLRMFLDTIATFEFIANNSESIFGDRSREVRAAISEYLDDFLRNPVASGEEHPETLIYRTSLQSFQRTGFYGAQLQIKERQVLSANARLREQLAIGQFWNKPFKKWIDVINNFLGSLAAATGLSEALKELKDCLRDELPDD
jgi:hypothetical protein